MTKRYIFITMFLICFCACERLELPTEGESSGNKNESSTTSPSEKEDTNENESGSYLSPFSVSEAQQQGELSGVWVKGYIVGYVEGTTIKKAQFATGGDTPSNLLLASDKSCTNISNCLPVQLPNGSKTRIALNLMDNPENLHKYVYLYGNLTNYFNVKGLKNTKEFEWVTPPDEYPTEGKDNETSTDSLYSTSLYMDFDDCETGYRFTNDNWITQNNKWCEWRIREDSLGNRYVSICYEADSSRYENVYEYWLITPKINLAAIPSPHLAYDTFYKDWDGETKLSVFLITTYVNLHLTPLLYAGGKIASPQYVDEGIWLCNKDIRINDGTDYAHLAFRFKGKASYTNSTQFGIDNIRIYNKEGEEN